ncbi:hypothetical protein V8C26DRAFT_390650 [Trichoderma gracile]
MTPLLSTNTVIPGRVISSTSFLWLHLTIRLGFWRLVLCRGIVLWLCSALEALKAVSCPVPHDRNRVQLNKE